MFQPFRRLRGRAPDLMIGAVLTFIAILAVGNSQTPTVHRPAWTKIWGDEFDAVGGLSNKDWIYDLGTGYRCSGCPQNWGTGEVEVMSSSIANVFQANGNLNIRALHSGGNPVSGWTSGRIETVRSDFQAVPGGAMAVELRLQQPNLNATNGAGYWPAAWMLGAQFRGRYTNWPGIGEVDITEAVNGRNSMFGTLHCGSYPKGPCNEPTGLGSGERPCLGCKTSFHTYRIELDRSVYPEELRWYLDGKEFFAVNSSQVDATTWDKATHHGFFIILNLAIGGGFPAAFGGGPTPATISGGTLLVDYVRVFYSSAAVGTKTPTPTPGPTPAPSTLLDNAQAAARPARGIGGNNKARVRSAVQPEDLVGIIKKQQGANVRVSYGEWAGQNFSDLDLERFIRVKMATRIANRLKSDQRFLKVVHAIEKMPENEMKDLLTRCLTISRPTWAELGRISSRGQTDAGQTAELLIGEAIVKLVRTLIAKE
jgi:beta-glucanase (GH16 family)